MTRDPADTDLKYLKGVGDVKARLMASELGIRSVRDLLYTPPLRYIDRSRMYRISELNPEMPQVQVLGRFVRFAEEGEGARRRLLGIFSDGHTLMQVTWFKGLRYVTEHIHAGMPYVLLGKPSEYMRSISMVLADRNTAPTRIHSQESGHNCGKRL